jgi:hypothetical protein
MKKKDPGTTIDRDTVGTTSAHAGNMGKGAKFTLPEHDGHADIKGNLNATAPTFGSEPMGAKK